MTAWFALAGAIGLEISGTLSLRMAATGRRIWMLGVLVGYVGAFSLLGLTLAHGMPLGVAYGIWSAVGVALTAVLSRLLFAEPLTPTMAFGIALIAAGVLTIEVGSH